MTFHLVDYTGQMLEQNLYSHVRGQFGTSVFQRYSILLLVSCLILDTFNIIFYILICSSFRTFSIYVKYVTEILMNK